MARHQEALVGWKPFSNSPQVASARLRCFGPLALLRGKGLPVELYQPQNHRHYRAVVLQKLYDSEHQELAKRLKAQGTRVVLDLCDNYLYTTDRDDALDVRADQLRRMLDIADAVTVSTPTLAEHLPRPASVIRDGVEPCRPRSSLRSLLAGRRRTGRLELLWFGTWGNPHLPFGMRDLLDVSDVLQDLSARTPVRLTVVSNSRRAYAEWIAPLALPTRYREWKSHANLCGMLPLHDACLIPIQPNPFTVCKSANRLALSLYLGVPVIATGIPSYEEFGGFCALDDWEAGLRAAGGGGQAWRARTEAGRSYVQAHHMMEHAAEEWRRFLKDVVSHEDWEAGPKGESVSPSLRRSPFSTV